MTPLSVPDAPKLRDLLRREINDSSHARYLNRLHCLLLIACGHNCYEVAHYFGESPRTLELWIHRYEEAGIDGLKDRPRGGPGSRKLTTPQLSALEVDLREHPGELGYAQSAWSGKLLVTHLERKYNVRLSVRHAQRLLRRPRP